MGKEMQERKQAVGVEWRRIEIQRERETGRGVKSKVQVYSWVFKIIAMGTKIVIRRRCEKSDFPVCFS